MNELDLWPLRWRGLLDDTAIRLVRGTPFNCLVVDSTTADFTGLCRQQGIEVKTLGGEGGIPAAPFGKIPVDSTSPVLAITECEWPRVRATDSKNSAEAGPTGVPWVDSNGWVSQLVRARAPQKAIWLSFDPPKDAQFFRSSAYALAVADSAGHGAKWIASPGEGRNWEATVAATRFFEQHKHWRDYRSLARLGILSDFTGDNEFTGAEMLNLTARRHQPFRAVDKTKPFDLSGLVAVIYPDKEAPTPAVSAKLASFVRDGGLLVIQPSAAKPLQGTATAEEHPRFRLLTSGKGRIAVGKEDWADPYIVAADAHLLMSHRNDLIRLFNHDSCGSYISGSPDGKSHLVQLFRYASRPSAEAMTLTVAGKYTSAKFYTLDEPQPKSIKPIPVKSGVDLPLPGFSVYGAVELGR